MADFFDIVLEFLLEVALFILGALGWLLIGVMIVVLIASGVAGGIVAANWLGAI